MDETATPAERQKRKQTLIPWPAIQEAATNEGLTIPELSNRFGVDAGTIRKRVNRGKLVIVARALGAIQRRAAVKAAEAAATKVANEWVERGENHRKVAFDLAHESLKKMKPKAPRNFREAELADKIARRAAGLDTADTVQQTLININEAMSADDEPTPVLEATLVPTEPTAAQPASLPEPVESPA